MNYLIISGSHRDPSQSSKVSNWLADDLKSKGHQVDVLDLGGNPVPLWDQSAWKGDSELTTQMKPYLDRVAKADAYIIVSPEWGGMVAAGLKNFLLYVSAKHAGHKPAMLVGVSSGRGGTYPIAELKMSGFKNNRIVLTPDHLIVQNVESVMNADTPEEGNEDDAYIQARARYSVDVLIAYSAALKTMRETNDLADERYPFGM